MTNTHHIHDNTIHVSRAGEPREWLWTSDDRRIAARIEESRETEADMANYLAAARGAIS